MGRPKTILTQDDVNEIIRLYQTEIKSTHKLGEKFKVTHKEIKRILDEHQIIINNKGGQPKEISTEQIESSKVEIRDSEDPNKILVAICKKTGIKFDDANNLSGCLTKHIIEEYGNVDIPSNTYQRKKYAIENDGRKWFEEYFDIIDLAKKGVRHCSLCDWTTEDLTNKTGCFEGHVCDKHHITIDEYCDIFPQESHFHKKYEIRKNLEIAENHVICQECGGKYKYISSNHVIKHDMTMTDYKLKYPTCPILSQKYKINLQEIYKTGLGMHENTWSTRPQTDINEYIQSLGFETLINNKKLLGGVEIDILIHEVKLGIEYNGVYYHTDTEKMKKHRTFHLNKTILMNDVGYKLIHIFEDEWFTNRELVKDKIKHLLGVNNNKTVGARKCEIVEIDKDDKNKFLKLYHIQGNDISSNIHLGAMYDDELVAVMCFDGERNMNGSNDFIINSDYELTRFATSTNYKLPGIADKLLKYFIANYNPTKILSFGDRRWVLDGDNCMYTKLGFKLINVLPPDFRYFNSKISRYKRLHKFGFSLDNIKKRYPHLDFLKEDGKEKTENELMLELGFDRIWDCGLFKYELKIERYGK